jgi:dipeptidyl aminopeptidase/acylaminoacyl peptidase
LGRRFFPAPARAQSFSLEQVLSYGFPTNLVASPEGGRLAWISNTEGRRNVWVAERAGRRAEWEARRLTAYLEDDGQEMGGLAFTPDGSRLIYTRGGGTNRSGERANPTSDIEMVTRELWLIGWEGGDPVRLTGGITTAMSPVEARIAWVNGRVVMAMDLDEARPTPRRLLRIRSSVGELRWSPDGSRLAFSSARDGRSILGVFDLEENRLEWITNTADRDRYPRWSPDGSQLAFIRFPAGHRGFAVCTVEVGTKQTREIFRSPDDATGRYPGSIAGSYDLMYGDGYLVFPGEWTDWNHLYAIPDTGGDARDLTPGKGIVENAVMSPDRKAVYVSTSIRSIDHRQLAWIRLSDGRTSWLVEDDVIAWNPAPFKGPTDDVEGVAYVRSTAAEPARVYFRYTVTPQEGRRAANMPSGAEVAISPLPRDFPSDRLVRPEQVVFAAADGWQIHGQLFVPRDRNRGETAPAVIFMHGGSRRQMLLGWHNRGYYHNAYAFNQYLAAKGYVVLSVNYRSGIGYGVTFREPDDYGWRGASEYQDIVAAGHFLRSLDYVDGDRIGLWGGSYGGYLTAMGLARDSDLFKAGVDLHGVHDWAEQLKWWGEGQIDAPTEAVRDSILQVAYESSPVAAMDSWRSPVLIIHADDDRNVPFEASIDLVARLRQKGDVLFEELYFVDDVHGFLLHRNWLAAYEAGADFFDRHLKGGGTRPAGTWGSRKY